MIDLHDFGSLLGHIFLPFLFLFGTVAIFNKLLIALWAACMFFLMILNASYHKERKQKIIQIIHFYQHKKLLKGKAPHYY